MSFKRRKGRVAILGVLTALALIASYVEALFPFSFGIPGIKLGLANCIIVVVLYMAGTKEAFGVSLVRIVLAGFLFGNMYSIVYSLAGGMLSLLVMCILKKTGLFSIAGVSVAGGATHNIGQLLMAAYVVENMNVFYYFPVLLVAGVVTGMIIGVIAAGIQKRIPNSKHEW